MHIEKPPWSSRPPLFCMCLLFNTADLDSQLIIRELQELTVIRHVPYIVLSTPS